MKVTIPQFCLVVLMGASGAGKSSFARRHFAATEVLSSDLCRALVSDDETAQQASDDAFELLHFIARKRLAGRRLTVVDATNVRSEDRRQLVALARELHALPVAVAFDLPESICQERNRARDDRNFGRHVVRNQRRLLRRSLHGLRREGFRYEYRFRSPDEVDAAVIERQPLWSDRRADRGPFDIIGDLHGCFDELSSLLGELGYEVREGDPAGGGFQVNHPDGRRLVFLGDLVDRGPCSVACLRLVMDAVSAGSALCVPGNHDAKLLRKLRGRDVKLTHGLAHTLEQLAAEPPEWRDRVAEFIDSLVSHYELDGGWLVVAHAGMKEELQGRASSAVRAFALYGETTGESDEFGLPVRYPWAGDYRGRAQVVYGHTPVPAAEWLNRTICIDTGCVFGGRLTALRYPENELVSVSAARTYAEPARPQAAPGGYALSAQQAHDDLLDLDDVAGKRVVATRLRGNVTVRAENAAAALEVMSRFAVDPKWLIYLPPTMAPGDTTATGDLLEHPQQAFDYYAGHGVRRVVCQQKHMGSRAVIVVCRDGAAARRRFGVAGDGGSGGMIHTRTGRRFFADAEWERSVLERLRTALTARGFWQRFATEWFCLDCELMPWSAKAGALLRQQYGPVAAAGRNGLAAAVAALRQAAERGVETRNLLQRYRARAARVDAYTEAYRRYCWTVAAVDDLQLAPFHLLASEGTVHADKDHGWHLATLAELSGDGIVVGTQARVVELADAASRAAATEWWRELTAAGGEGMVVKPWKFVATGTRGLIQPALKCRGREYLRIIYGPEYTALEHLARLRERGVGTKRSLALREFALGIEALERFVRGEPLRRVHECVFAVLALESQPVDPRL